VKTYTDEIAKLKAQIAALEKEKASVIDPKPLQDEIAKLKAQIAALEKEKASVIDPKPLQDEIAKLKAQIAALEKEKASAGDCSECDKALANSKAALAAAEAKVSDLEAKLAAGDKSAELTAEINRLKEEIKKKDNQINGCKLISDKCTKKLADVEALLAASEKAKALCNTEYEDLKKQIIAMDEDMGKLGEIIKTNNAEISKLNAEMGTLRTQLKECETKLSAATAPKEETPN
jgi:chromosome segregation ATPase